MRCPRCKAKAYRTTWRSICTRKRKTIWFKANCWQCSNCRIAVGPFRFLTPELEDENEVLASIEWQKQYNEVIPPDYPINRIKKIMRTKEGRDRVANAFGKALEKEVNRKNGHIHVYVFLIV